MENNNQQPHSEHDKMVNHVLDKIRAGEVHMRSRWHFTLKVILLAFLFVVVLFGAALLVSFMLFSLRASGQQFLLGFGFNGIHLFLFLFPWRLLAVELLLVYALGKLIKRFKVGYQHPLLYVGGGVVAVALVVGVLIDRSHIHEQLLHRAEHKNLPVLGDMYAHVRRPAPDMGVIRGTIISLQPQMFVVLDDQDDSYIDGSSTITNIINSATSTIVDSDTSTSTHKIVPPPGVTFPTFIKIGDHVFVAGKMIDPSGHTIEAYGIEEITDQE